MNRILHIIFLSAACACATLPAHAQSEDEVYDRIEALHGDAEGFDEVFELVQQAMTYGDPVTVAQHASYPLTVQANGEVYDILREQDLIENYDRLIMQETRNGVADQEYAELFVNSDGVMLAGGALWMAAVCGDSACTSSRWAITAINN